MSIKKSEVKPTAAVVLDTRRQKANGTYPIRLRLTYQRERKYYTIKLDDLTSNDWEKLKILGKLKDKRLIEIRSKIGDYESLARNVIKTIPRFTFARFEEGFFTDHSIDAKSSADDIFQMFKEVAEKLRQQGRVSTATGYDTAANSLRTFQGKLRVSDVTSAFLEDYESEQRRQGKSPTTVGIYLRNLRAIVRIAQKMKLLTDDEYPFGKGRYEIPAARNIKKALKLSEIEKIYNYQTEEGSAAHRAKDFWLFSYLCNGINVKDICRLRWKDVSNDNITFIRAKTARTKKSELKPVLAVLTPALQAIINRQATSVRNFEAYVFPILPSNVTPQRERELVQYLTRSINKYIRRIAAELGISKPVTTYTARHSFATVLKRSGASNEYIGEQLSHSSLRSTASYIDSIDDEDVKLKYANKLLDFQSNQ